MYGGKKIRNLCTSACNILKFWCRNVSSKLKPIKYNCDCDVNEKSSRCHALIFNPLYKRPQDRLTQVGRVWKKKFSVLVRERVKTVDITPPEAPTAFIPISVHTYTSNLGIQPGHRGQMNSRPRDGLTKLTSMNYFVQISSEGLE